MTVTGFYLLARTIDAIRLMARDPLTGTGTIVSDLIARLVDGLAYLLPDLGKFAHSDWLIYQTASGAEIALVLAQTGIYVGLLIAAGLFDLYRKNF